ncbi:MAG TPA: TRAP transporter small permease [Candidatus Goldiibacteriota bacterium]|mgnify:CR=1 FL=1|nr:TRAP transporter small permease [Candidatus Goldiibacteriota bacterium]
MRFLRKLNYRLYKIQKTAVVVLFACLLLLAFTQVVLRLFFRAGIENADSVTRYLVLWIGFLGASLATYKNRHINIDVISQVLGLKGNKPLSAVVNAVAFAVSGFLCYGSVIFVMNETADPARVMFIPLWVLELALPVSFLFMSLRFFQNSVDAVINSRKKRKKAGAV